jgi:serine/threonine protein kinase
MNTDSHPSDSRRINLLRPLGKGGFGAVFLADVHSADGLVHRMAVKVLHEKFSMEGEIGARARDEARLMSQLNHDNVVQVFGLTRIGKRSAVLMEYVEGIDCSALIQAATLRGEGVPLRVAARIIECAADALHAAYHTVSPQTKRQLCVVHRDIKPGNILVSVNGAVKVMDFGVARADFEREAVTKSHQFGTQRYMAPERWLEGEAVAKSDVFALGLSFWELVTGEKFAQVPLAPRKYEERLSESVEIFRQHAQAQGRVEGVTEALIRGMLAYKVEKRFSAKSVSEILGEISEIQPGPSLRRYARKWIPALLKEREAAMAADSGIESFSGSLSADMGAERSTPTLSVPTSQQVSDNRDPRAAPTLFEQVEPLPEKASGPVKLDPLVEKESPVPTNATRSPRRKVFLLSFGVSLVLGAAWILKGEMGAGTPDLIPVGSGTQANQEDGSETEEEPAGTQNPCSPKVPGVLQQAEPPLFKPPTPIEKPIVKSVEKVRLKVLADPREGRVFVGEQIVGVSEEVTLPVGVHRFQYEGDGWTAACEVPIGAGVRKIKFLKGTGACVLLP